MVLNAKVPPAILNATCLKNPGEFLMWTKPTYQDMRLGFEVTLYISNR